MSPGLASWLVRLYPREWRERFGPELEDLLETEPASLSTLFDLTRAAAWEQLSSHSQWGDGEMQTYPSSVAAMVRKPSAFIPFAMSLCTIAMLVVSISMNDGAVRDTDEGAVAHLFQLLMVGQIPILAFFALKWLRRDWKAGLSVLALQIAGMVAAAFPVWLLGL